MEHLCCTVQTHRSTSCDSRVLSGRVGPATQPRPARAGLCHTPSWISPQGLRLHSAGHAAAPGFCPAWPDAGHRPAPGRGHGHRHDHRDLDLRAALGDHPRGADHHRHPRRLVAGRRPHLHRRPGLRRAGLGLPAHRRRLRVPARGILHPRGLHVGLGQLLEHPLGHHRRHLDGVRPLHRVLRRDDHVPAAARRRRGDRRHLGHQLRRRADRHHGADDDHRRQAGGGAGAARRRHRPLGRRGRRSVAAERRRAHRRAARSAAARHRRRPLRLRRLAHGHLHRRRNHRPGADAAARAHHRRRRGHALLHRVERRLPLRAAARRRAPVAAHRGRRRAGAGRARRRLGGVGAGRRSRRWARSPASCSPGRGCTCRWPRTA